jgi:hypothetical protein
VTRSSTPPPRMKNHRVQAEPRQSPDLHQLARLFIGMAQARARDAHTAHSAPDPGSTAAESPGLADRPSGARDESGAPR